MNTTTTPKPEALVTTPAEATECPACTVWSDEYDLSTPVKGVRYPGDEAGKTFAHCPNCGRTDLLDVRSPFEVLLEARRNVDGLPLPTSFGVPVPPESAVVVRWERQDVVVRVEAIARSVDPDHLAFCSDCEKAARRAGIETAR